MYGNLINEVHNLAQDDDRKEGEEDKGGLV